MTSKQVQAAEAAILPLALAVAPSARLHSSAGRGAYSCMIVVDTDAEKKRLKEDVELLAKMKRAAAEVGREPEFLSAESQETVDRRWNGDWNYVWR